MKNIWKCEDSSVGLATGLNDRRTEVQLPSDIFLVSSGAHPDSHLMGTKTLSPGHEADHSPSSSAEVKNAWSYTSTPPYTFMVWCLMKSTGTLPYHGYSHSLCPMSCNYRKPWRIIPSTIPECSSINSNKHFLYFYTALLRILNLSILH
jgi:hypothetical protein